MRFKAGDKVSAPISGICEVHGIEEQTILGEPYRVLVLSPLDPALDALKIPEARLGEMGLRKLAEAEDAERLLNQDVEVELPQGKPHQRIKKWTKRLRAGQFGIRRKVLMEFERLKLKKGARISRDENRFIDRIRENFRQELQLSLGLNPSQAGRKLSAALQ